MKSKTWRLVTIAFLACLAPQPARGDDAKPPAVPTTLPAASPGEKIPSEEPLIADFHSLGLIDGRTNIFRSASPLRDISKNDKLSDADFDRESRRRMQRLADLGIKTIISLELTDPAAKKTDTPADVSAKAKRFAAEKKLAAELGIQLVNAPLANAGDNSLEKLTSRQVAQLLAKTSALILSASEKGGVLFHCSAGHDRTGIVAAYIRIAKQRWSVDQAIDEMRRLGHNWPRFSSTDGKGSWHEAHLRAIARTLNAGG